MSLLSKRPPDGAFLFTAMLFFYIYGMASFYLNVICSIARQYPGLDDLGFGLDFEDLEDLQSLVDQVLSEKQEEEGFLVFVRLSPVPEFLVEGYDFKMLNRLAQKMRVTRQYAKSSFISDL